MKVTPHRLRNSFRFTAVAIALICLGSVARGGPASVPEDLFAFPPESQLEPLAWTAVEGWQADDHAAAFTVFKASCKPLVNSQKWLERKGKKPRDTRPMRAALTEVCMRAVETEPADGAAARAFFETNFRPVAVGQLGEKTGLLTGYYEPIIEGARFPSHEYVVPVYAPPPNLVALGRRSREGGFPNKGRVGRRIGPNKIVPFYDRGEIEEGVLAGRDLEICWVKDPIDAFFMQIQGSARIKLDTGKTLRLNYAAHNGHSYTPVGRILIERDLVSKEAMSMDRIREWMEKNPDGGKELRRQNRSYVFMRETGLSDDVEPTGAQGVPLTPSRSIAVDKKLHVYGTPFFISAKLPIESERPATPFQRLMVAQDTGSAIVGVARADIYFGAGEEAGRIGGRIKQQGQFVMLVPKTIDVAGVFGNPPVPAPRPAQPGDPVRVASFPSTVAPAVTDVPAAAAAVFDGAKPPKSGAAAMAKSRALAYAPEPGQTAVATPLSGIQRAEQTAPRPEAVASRPPPAWLFSVGLISSAAATEAPAEHQPRSFASAQSAIMAAASAPAAFAAPAITNVAATMLRRMARTRTVPVPRPRPQGIVPVRQ